MAATAASTATPPAPAPPAGPRFRPDVEGLRALAVGLVLWYHAGLPLLSGGFAGVDVFFVISGFLITGQLVREVEATGRISLPRFYARRAKRLFPAAATALLASAALTWAVLPKVRWPEYGGDIAAAAGYVVNWRLAARSVDYLAEGTEPSPVQHFWSLAVEEQYYIVWPLLLLLLAVLIRSRSLSVRPVMAAGLALIVVPSLAWSVVATATSTASAYFVTTTRLWELGVGALVAVGTGLWARLPRAAALAVGWAGLATIAAGAVLQSTSTPWPGSAALVPTLGAAAVIVAGQTSGPAGPVALLGLRPAVWVGGLSYSLYLWHWPLVVAAGSALGGLGPLQGLAVVVASAVPAWLTHRYVENPFRYSPAVSRSPRLALSLGLNLSLVGVAAGLALSLAAGAGAPAPQASDVPGARVLGTGSTPTRVPPPTAPSGAVTPSPVSARDDVPRAYADGCQVGPESSTVVSCTYGDTTSGFTVALVGDSKALQWLPALQRIGEQQHWKVVTYTKSACAWTPVTTELSGGDPYTTCVAWGKDVLRRLTGAEKPDLVVTSGLRSSALTAAGPDQPAFVDGYVAYWDRLGRAGVPVLALSDSPSPGMTVYECVGEHPDDYMTACRYDYVRSAGTAVLTAAARKVPTAGFADMDPWTCPGEQRCPPVIGGVLVNRQGSHITATYAASIAAPLQRKITAFLDAQDVRVPRG